MTRNTIAALVVMVLAVVPAHAQRRGGRPFDQPGGGPAELQRMFDAYALMQAQEQLGITDQQYSQFLTRFKALQDIRHRGLQERTRLIVELRRLSNEPQADDTRLKERMKALEETDVRTAAEVRKAYETIDQVLDVRQQAKFRAFEEQMERRKLDLLMRARQANRPRNPL